MELAGVVSMPGGVRPDLLKHVLVKGLEVCGTHDIVGFCY